MVMNITPRQTPTLPHHRKVGRPLLRRSPLMPILGAVEMGEGAMGEGAMGEGAGGSTTAPHLLPHLTDLHRLTTLHHTARLAGCTHTQAQSGGMGMAVGMMMIVIRMKIIRRMMFRLMMTEGAFCQGGTVS